MILSAIVAKSSNNVIGIDNDLPWRISEDMKWFKESTMGKPVIMGRKTWLSLPKILPGRQNIVLTRDSGFIAPGADIAHSLDAALELADKSKEEVMIIGGAEIYKLAFKKLDRLYLTEIHREIDGDTYFPNFDPLDWRETHREDRVSKKDPDLKFSWLIMERK